jgi:hypothetical protein
VLGVVALAGGVAGVSAGADGSTVTLVCPGAGVVRSVEKYTAAAIAANATTTIAIADVPELVGAGFTSRTRSRVGTSVVLFVILCLRVIFNAGKSVNESSYLALHALLQWWYNAVAAEEFPSACLWVLTIWGHVANQDSQWGS